MTTRRSSPEKKSDDMVFPTLAELEREYWDSLDETERRIVGRTRVGSACLRMGQLNEAIAAFDEAARLSGPKQRYLWQRGVTLFYLERYDEAFEDLLRNAELYESRFDEPATEERLLAAAAAKLAEGKTDDDFRAVLDGIDAFPRDSDEGAKETRVVLRLATQLFRGQCKPRAFLKVTDQSDDNDPMRRKLVSHYYAGLYWDALRRDPVRAKAHMLHSQYRADLDPDQGDDLICQLPTIHLEVRGWDPTDVDEPAVQRAMRFE